MARIRTIKPEFWDSPDVMALSLGARLTFIGLITQADDQGRVCETLPKLTGILHPAGDVPTDQVGDWVDELIKQGVVIAASWKRRLVLHLTGWEDHQRVDKAKDPRLPPADGEMDGCRSHVLESCRSPLDDESREDFATPSRESREDGATVSAPDHGISGTDGIMGSGDQTHATNDLELLAEVPECDHESRTIPDDPCDDCLTFHEEFWPVYPQRNGKKLTKAEALVEWRDMSPGEQSRAVVGAKHLAASDHMPKDAVRFLREKSGVRPFEEWQEPAARGSPGPKRTDTFDKTEEF